MLKVKPIKKLENMKSEQLDQILERIKTRKTTVKHFFNSTHVNCTKLQRNPSVLPPLKLNNKKSKSCTHLYTSMEIYLANIPPKTIKPTVQQLMKMTTNAKALVSQGNLESHREKILKFMGKGSSIIFSSKNLT